MVFLRGAVHAANVGGRLNGRPLRLVKITAVARRLIDDKAALQYTAGNCDGYNSCSCCRRPAVVMPNVVIVSFLSSAVFKLMIRPIYVNKLHILGNIMILFAHCI